MGLLVGLTPTVGVQTILMIILCVLIRASFPAAFLVSWVSNPLTAPALYFAFNRLGEAVFGQMLAPLLPADGLADEATRQTVYLALGSGLIALPAALLGYGLFLAIRWSADAGRGVESGMAGIRPRTTTGPCRPTGQACPRRAAPGRGACWVVAFWLGSHSSGGGAFAMVGKPVGPASGFYPVLRSVACADRRG
ncbi:MAG: DUF2062 domain-containing protein, partial [Thiohalorhabdaceae bacterium]